MPKTNNEKNSNVHASAGSAPKSSATEEVAAKHLEDVSSTTGDIDSSQARFVYVGPDTSIAVDGATGRILGQGGEGTLGIVIYGGEAKERRGKRFEVERAIRIPRLLQGDVLLNFHVAEIVYHESRQAFKFNNSTTLLGANNFYRLDEAAPYTKIPNDSPSTSSGPAKGCFVGFYLSPTAHYRLCLVSEEEAWPAAFSDYLTKIGFNCQALYGELLRKSEFKQTNVFSKLFFLPDNIEPNHSPKDPASLDKTEFVTSKEIDSGTNSISPLQELNRYTLDSEHVSKREVGGWWFNIPVAIYPWMTANLERLLTAYVDNDTGGNEISTLRSWNVQQWFKLITQMASGFNELHQEGAIHGDPRPANIMTNIRNGPDFRPGNFRWIDIGLGYGAKDIIREGNPPIDEESVISPRPLGGGRSTIFYAPERAEALEFEDADMVYLKQSQSNKRFSELTFSWRERSHLPPTDLQLKVGNVPVRELGSLKRGDRIQVREFLLEVDEVKEKSITVSDIYEVLLDRVLVERNERRSLVHERLNGASISRYRIFKQWGQATDIYSLGILAMYLFFLRGVQQLKAPPVSVSDIPDDQLALSSVYDQTNREKTFAELVSLMQNQSFLGNILSAFKKEIGNPNSLMELKSKEPISEASQKAEEKIAEEILVRDANFIFIWRGLEGSNSLFIRLIFFCFCCLSREDDIQGVLEGRGIELAAFCKNRLMINAKEDRAGPSQKALSALETLESLSAGVPTYEGGLPEFVNADTILRSRENQWLRVTENLTKSNEKNEQLEQALRQATDQVDVLTENLSNAKAAKSALAEIRAILTPAVRTFAQGRTKVFLHKKAVEKSILQACQLAEGVGSGRDK